MVTEKDLYAERSQLDSRNLHDASRAAAQATILINGGAATAVLAFVTKEGIAGLLVPAAYALGGYAVGVVFGTLILYARTRALEWWMRFGSYKALDYAAVRVEGAYRRGVVWERISTICFALAILSFLGASAQMVMALLNR